MTSGKCSFSRTQFKKGQIPHNKVKLHDGSFYPPIFDLCHCKRHYGTIVYNGKQFVIGHESIGRKQSDKQRKQKSIRMSGSNHPMWNKHHTRETRDKMSKSSLGIKKGKNTPEHNIHIGDAIRGNKHWNYGNHLSDSQKKKMSVSLSGSGNGMYGISPSIKCHRGCGSYYQSPLQGQVYLRSSWEIKYAKYLDSKKILWMYEIETFPITIDGKNYTYTPDFFLPKFEKFIEIKGNPKGNADKIKQFREEYPFDLDVLCKEELQMLGINLNTKEPKCIFKDRQQEECLLKQLE